MEEEACLETRSNRSLEDAHFHLSIPPVVSFLEESEEGEKCRSHYYEFLAILYSRNLVGLV